MVGRRDRVHSQAITGSRMTGRVMSVCGPVQPSDVGFTLPHEHTGERLWGVRGREDYFQLSADGSVLEDLHGYRRSGGSTLVDLTLEGIGRDPERLVRLSLETGIHIVMGCGWYRSSYYPADAKIDERSVDDLTAELVREFEAGVGASQARPGIIGEIGVDKWWVNPREERVHRAAARAANVTGMAITTHSPYSDVGLAQLDIFVDEGVDPSRVVIGHADTYPDLDYWLAVTERGAMIEIDNLGAWSLDPATRRREARVIRLLHEMLDRGHAHSVLLSHDVCHNAHLKANGGNGYVYLLEALLPELRRSGVTDAQIHALTVSNPVRLLTLA
jgi:phosphotriesterase-related protein